MNRSLLIVEDDREQLDLFCRWFIRRGYRVTAVHHPRQALEAATFKEFQVAVVDQGLPEMDGTQLMLRLKLLGDIQVIVLSGYDDDFGFESDDAFAYLVKPCEMTELDAAVEEAFASSESALWGLGEPMETV